MRPHSWPLIPPPGRFWIVVLRRSRLSEQTDNGSFLFLLTYQARTATTVGVVGISLTTLV